MSNAINLYILRPPYCYNIKILYHFVIKIKFIGIGDIVYILIFTNFLEILFVFIFQLIVDSNGLGDYANVFLLKINRVNDII
ncbi:hypothetical protein C7M60_05120 [Clostridium botulinum]|nr:hypothetical protein C7M60_05120 [Clostridium botulinum]AVQ48799.1 hypothetical protein C7M58_05385 [Clostridium botulinum]